MATEHAPLGSADAQQVRAHWNFAEMQVKHGTDQSGAFGASVAVTDAITR